MRGNADRVSRWYAAERVFISRPPVKLAGREAAAAWWRHGFSLAQSLPGFPRPLFPSREKVAESARRRATYIAALRQLGGEDSQANRDRVAELEVYLTLKEILQYRADYKNRNEEDAQEYAAGLQGGSELLSNLEDEIEEEDDEEEDLTSTSDVKPGRTFLLRMNVASAKLILVTERDIIHRSDLKFLQRAAEQSKREHLCRVDVRQFSMVASRTPNTSEDSKTRGQLTTLEVRLRDFEICVHRLVRWQPVLRFEPLSESEPFAVSVTMSKVAEEELARISCRVRCGKAQVRADQRDITRIEGLFAAEKRISALTIVTTKATLSGRREIQRSLQRRVEKVLHPLGAELHLVLESGGVLSVMRDWYNSSYEMVQMNRLEPLVITVERRDSFYMKVVDAAGAAGLPLVRSMHLEPVEAQSVKLTPSESRQEVAELWTSLAEQAAAQASPCSTNSSLPSMLDVCTGGMVLKWCANVSKKRPRHLRVCPARRALTWGEVRGGPVHGLLPLDQILDVVVGTGFLDTHVQAHVDGDRVFVVVCRARALVVEAPTREDCIAWHLAIRSLVLAIRAGAINEKLAELKFGDPEPLKPAVTMWARRAGGKLSGIYESCFSTKSPSTPRSPAFSDPHLGESGPTSRSSSNDPRRGLKESRSLLGVNGTSHQPIVASEDKQVGQNREGL
jgi:hypothetical protein